MDKPRIFLGSSGQQEELLDALTKGLDDIAEVIPWTTSFNAGMMTLDRLFELAADVDFAAFIFARDDWTARGGLAPDSAAAGVASPRDNVVYEAGLFGGLVGMRRTFILHAKGAKLPTDLLGLTAVRYGDEDGGPATEADVADILAKIRTAITAERRTSRIEGLWWQFSLTERSELEPSAVSLLRISRGRDRALTVNGRGWNADGSLSSRYWSLAASETKDVPGIFYYHNGERPRQAGSPRFEGTGEIKLESADRAAGYWVTLQENPHVNIRTSGVYLRADEDDLRALDEGDDAERAALIAARLQRWRSIAQS
ncbi:MAG: nucleotide-binding protein [Actinomycetota bacterium]|nr:nucleotide-binding protein [Actinomycetota bacterium]